MEVIDAEKYKQIRTSLDGNKWDFAVLDEYCKKDVEATEEAYIRIEGGRKPKMFTKYNPYTDLVKATLNHKFGMPDLEPTRVIFNGPATIVFWNDGTKTVTKCSSEDSYDQEKGLAMAFAKKMLGNNWKFYGRFQKLIKKASKNCKED